MFELIPLLFEGCFEIRARVFADHRGRFIKLFHTETFGQFGLTADIKRVAYTVSHMGVVRGIYTQNPADASPLLATCPEGEILVVLVDLRKSSTHFGKVYATKLSGAVGSMLYIPAGVAYGYVALGDDAVFLSLGAEKTQAEKNPGIHWKSIDFSWPIDSPVVSDEDQRFTPLGSYQSPF